MARDDIWDALKKDRRDKFDSDRQRFLEEATEADDGGWTKHNTYHWSRYVNGHQLQYWPSRKKYMYRGKVRRGDVYDFIRSLAK